MEEKEPIRVLITSIGGGKTENKDGVKTLKKYDDTIYTIKKENGEDYEEKTSYMPLVIENAYNINKTIIIGTTGSMWDNLYEKYCDKYKNLVKKDEEYKKSLIDIQINSKRETPITDINIDVFNSTFKEKVKGIVIKYGINRDEIFENFDLIIKLQEEFNNTDKYEVYLDITHSFRSMAFWMFLVMTYLTDVSNKNIKIAGITYGMFEAKKDDITPIVVLKPFLEILNWIKGASELKQYGNSYSISNNLENIEIKNGLKNFSNAMNMNYIGSLLESLDNLEILEKNIEFKGPSKHIIPDVLKNFIKDFDLKEKDTNKRRYLLQAILAKWHFSQKRYAMAAININEALANFIGNSLKLNPKNSVKFDPNSEAKNWLRELYKIFGKKENINEIEKIYKKYGEIYYHTRRIRNEIAHSLGNEINIEEDIGRLELYSNEILKLLENENFIIETEQTLKLLEKKKEKTQIKDKVDTLEVREKNILLLSTKELSNKEEDELKVRWKIKNIINLSSDELKSWREISTEDNLQAFKNIIDENLVKGDYILIHGNLKNIIKMQGYANTKELISLYLVDPYSLSRNFFEKC